MCMSARSGEGADRLVEKLLELLSADRREFSLKIPYSDAGIVDLLKREAVVSALEYAEDGIEVCAVLTPELFGRMKKYIPDLPEEKEEWDV